MKNSLPSKVEIGDIKIGSNFRGGWGDEIIIDVEHSHNIITFKTSIEDGKRFIETEYCGNKKGRYLINIFTAGRGTIRYYKFGASSPWPRKESEGR